ncbi:dityrosine transporter [Fusarium tjaetaba]|uniref:Dityrosine transporter n=1 Tax=Fusarium tjaetaba TaxID=1567544 RepID=A0A8H5VC90_9HYPO|nr:dityrosine transporter [Fusarium tjaetaba]KAF5619157.1 dityrosine transporter [Fusarium tjaetaba]
MNSLKRRVQCNSHFKEFPTKDQKKIMEYVQLQLQFCADITRLYSISDPEELSAFIQHTFSFMSNVILPDHKALREIIDNNLVPPKIPPKPVPIDLDEVSRRLEVEAQRRSEIQRRQLIAWLWSWVPWPFATKEPAATEQETGKGTKRTREDVRDEELPRRQKVIRKCKSTAVASKLDSEL